MFHLSNWLARTFAGAAESGSTHEGLSFHAVDDVEDALESDVFSDQIVLNAAIESSPGRPLRILCLHGRGANNDITAIQLVSLNMHTCTMVDLLHGGVQCAAADASFNLLSESKFHAWLDDCWTLGDLERAMRRVLNVAIRHGPYDGIYGFSQGAAIATCLSLPGVAERLGGQRTWKFVICACGVDVGLTEVKREHKIEPKLLDLPSLHIIGENDPIARSSRSLAQACVGPTVVTHCYGHELPVALRREANFQAQVRNFLNGALHRTNADVSA